MRSELAERISQLPQLYVAGNKSTATLLKDAGYLASRRYLIVEDVEKALKREPRLIDLWLIRAADQRIVGGWGINHEKGAYRVHNYSDGNCLMEPDRFRACAHFVVQYVSFIGDVLARWS